MSIEYQVDTDAKPMVPGYKHAFPYQLSNTRTGNKTLNTDAKVLSPQQ